MGFEIGKTVAGYEVVELLGTSKTGLAYKVRNIFAQRFEVLKLLPKSIQDDEEQNARFLREIKVHAQLLHPNIVTFYNAREIEGQLVMTKEFVPGVTLMKRLQSGPIAWREASHYACQSLSALEYAHAHGIIHRGFTSSKLIITDEGIARLNGFSFAKSASDPELTAAGVVIGALKYMSPEQVKGEAVDVRSDIYSFGIVFYEMLAGKVPFDAKGQFEIMMAQVSAAPKHVSDVNPDVPRDLGDLIAKALAKSPNDRFQTAREFRESIEQMILSQDAAVSPSKATPVAEIQAPTPAAEPAPLAETPRAASPAPLADAWALESALELAESKLATMELQSSQPAADQPELVEPPVPVQSTAFAEPPSIDCKSEATSSPCAVETAELWEAPVAVAPAPFDWWTLDALPAPVESKLGETVLEPAQAIGEVTAISDAPTQALATNLSDAIAIESGIDSAESEPASLKSELELPPPVAIAAEPSVEPLQPAVEESSLNESHAIIPSAGVPDSPTIESAIAPAESNPDSIMESSADAIVVEPAEVPQAPVLDWWTLHSQPESESTPPAAEFTHLSEEAESAKPDVTALASIDSTVDSQPSAPPDLWTADWRTAAIESQPDPVQLELLSAALEAATPEAPAPVNSALSSPQDLWATEPSPDAFESKLPEPAYSSLAPESALHDKHEEVAEEVLSLWTSGPPDTWVSEPAVPPAPSTPETTEQPALSAVESHEAPVEPLPQTEASISPALLEEQQTIESHPAAAEEAAQMEPESAPEAAVAAAATVAAAPVPAVPKPVQVNPDLLTALFGDTLLSRVSLILVVCAITFFLGTVALFAVLSVTKP